MFLNFSSSNFNTVFETTKVMQFWSTVEELLNVCNNNSNFNQFAQFTTVSASLFSGHETPKNLKYSLYFHTQLQQ